MKGKYELIYVLIAVLLVIASVLFTKAVWESGLPEWLKILILR